MRRKVAKFIFKCVAVRQVTNVMEKRGDTDQGLMSPGDSGNGAVIKSIAVSIVVHVDVVDDSLGDMNRTQRVFKTGVNAARKHEVRESKLAGSAQSLESRMVDDFDFVRGEPDIPVDWQVEFLMLTIHFCVFLNHGTGARS